MWSPYFLWDSGVRKCRTATPGRNVCILKDELREHLYSSNIRCTVVYMLQCRSATCKATAGRGACTCGGHHLALSTGSLLN